MKQLLRFFFASVLLVPAALVAASFEGKVTFKMTSPREKDKAQEMTYQIKGDKFRVEVPAAKGQGMGGMIMDMGKREMIMLMDEQKMYMTMGLPDAAVDAVAKQGDDVTLEKTNETEKILGYTATKYIATHKNEKTDLWLAEGLGTFMSMSNANPMGRGRGSPQQKSWEKALAGKELFPLRVVGYDKANKENFRMEVTAIDKTKLPDSLFAPPAGYQKFDMGGMMKGLIPGAR